MREELPEEIPIDEGPEEMPIASQRPSATVRYPTQAFGSIASGLAGAYGSLLDALRLAPKEMMTPGQKSLYEAEFNAPESVLPFLQDEDIMPRYARLPTTREAAKYLEPEAKTAGERYTQKIGEAVGGSLAFGGNAATTGQMGIAAGLGQSARELGAPEAVATTVELLTMFGPQALAKKIVYPKDLKALASFAKDQGFTSSEVQALLKGKASQSLLGKFAKKDEKTEKYLENMHEKFGDIYEGVKAEAGNVPISKQQNSNLVEAFQMVKKDITDTLNMTPEQEKAANFIGETIEKISQKGTTPKEAINFYQAINRMIPWSKDGKKYLAALKDPIHAMLKEANPEVAKNFNMTNELFSRFAGLRKVLKPTQLDEIKKAGPAGAILIGLITGTSIPGALVKYAKLDVGQRLARLMLTSPRLSRIPGKLVQEMKSNKSKSANALIKLFGQEIKREDPELAEELKL